MFRIAVYIFIIPSEQNRGTNTSLAVVEVCVRYSARLIRDGTGQHKLKVSLPGGRYQLSLDDRAINVVKDDLGRDTGETIPEAFVPFFVAFGDAWFPNEKDTSSLIKDLPAGKGLDAKEQNILIAYVTNTLIPSKNETYAIEALNQSPISEEVSPDDLRLKELPSPPEGIFQDSTGAEFGRDNTQQESLSEDSTEEPVEEDTAGVSTDQEAIDENLIEEFEKLPGVGPKRAEAIARSGITSLEELAESRPVEMGAVTQFSEDMTAVAIEGAREAVSDKRPTHERLANQTGENEEKFENALSELADSGIPATDAENTLRSLYGPRITAVDIVTNRQAYLLWEAGYHTPQDLVDASLAELQEVTGVGETTVAEIQLAAKEFLEEL